MNRNYTIDTLRTIATLLVILLHTSAEYVNKGLTYNVYDTSFWIGNIVDSFSRICVPLFVLISGMFLIGRNETFSQSYKNRASRILIPLIVWSLIYLIYTAMFNYIAYNTFDLTALVKSLFLGIPFFHMWYLYMLIGLYLVTPIINNNIPKISRNALWAISISLLVFGMIHGFYNMVLGNKPIFILWFVDYLGYFLLGYLIMDSKIKISSILLLMIYLISGSLISLFSYYTAKSYNNLYFYGYLSIFVIISSISIYKLFHQFSFKENFLSRISHLTFGIYLVHAGILESLVLGLKVLNIHFLDNAIIGIPVKFSTVFVISLLIVYQIYNSKLLKRII